MKSTTLNNIRIIRESKGFSQEYVAKKLNITQQAYSSMEKNPDMMTLKRLKNLCKILDINLSTLLGEDNFSANHNYHQKDGKTVNQMNVNANANQEIEVYQAYVSSLKDEINQYRKVIDSMNK
ncbi:MAG: helix-turn-helix domain-containing protein [Bacteroidia bacterium]|nr:helix-turn-helix domain-containing protein [Bacteroidia bacterium]